MVSRTKTKDEYNKEARMMLPIIKQFVESPAFDWLYTSELKAAFMKYSKDVFKIDPALNEKKYTRNDINKVVVGILRNLLNNPNAYLELTFWSITDGNDGIRRSAGLIQNTIEKKIWDIDAQLYAHLLLEDENLT